MLVALIRGLALCGLVMLLGLLFSGCASAPDDEVLIEKFVQNRKDFDRLLLISQAQWKRYHTIDIRSDGDMEAHRIMKRLGIRLVLGDESHVSFYANGMSADSKGYEFFTPGNNSQFPPPDKIVPSLDALDESKLEAYATRYKVIDGRWFLFCTFESDNGRTKPE